MSWGAVVAIGGAVIKGYGDHQAAKGQQQSSKNAAEAQLIAAREANDLQREMYDKNLRIQQPWLQSGGLAQASLAGALGLAPQYDTSSGSNEFGASGDQMNQAANQFRGQLTKTFTPDDIYTDPSYKWRMEQGQKSLEASAAARGGLLTGQGLKDISDYGQKSASQEYQNAFDRFNINQTNLYNRLSGLAGTGQTASANMSASGQNLANQSGSNLIGGQMRASDYMTQGANVKAWDTQNTYNSIGNLIGGATDAWKGSQGGGGRAAPGGNASDYTGDAYRDWAGRQIN